MYKQQFMYVFISLAIYMEWNNKQWIKINRSTEIKKYIWDFLEFNLNSLRGVQSVCCVFPEGERGRGRKIIYILLPQLKSVLWMPIEMYA